MSGKPHDVLGTREARAQLSTMLERFRKDGADAEPVVIGARRRPEAVVLSYVEGEEALLLYLRRRGGRRGLEAMGVEQARSWQPLCGARAS